MADLLLRAHEFSQDAGIISVKSGQTLSEMLQEANQGSDLSSHLEVRVGGYTVPPEMWHRVRPKEGTVITVTRLGLEGKTARQVVAAVIMVVAAVYGQQWAASAAQAWGWGATGAAFLQAGITMAASLAASALTKPPSQSLSGNDSGKWNQLTGSSNQINPYGVIPFVIGESKLFPTHAAYPFSQALGSDNYQVCMFDLGYGNIDVSSLKIGDTPISEYQDVEYEVTKNPTLYTNDVSEVAVTATLNDDDDEVIRTTTPTVHQIWIDLAAVGGLYGVGDTGKKFDTWVRFEVKYRKVGDTEWLAPPGPWLGRIAPLSPGVFEATGRTSKPYTCGIAWNVDPGQYEVKVKRTASHSSSNTGNTFVQDFTWTIMRGFRNVYPSTTNTNKLAMRIRASEQLNGTLQTLSCVVSQKIKVYDRNTRTWSEPQANTNPAWVVYWLMTECEAFSARVPASRINLDSFADFAEFCDERGFEARGVVDGATTANELISDILSCSLGSLGRRDGRYSIVFDSGDSTPVMAFTPMESSGVTMSRQFIRLPHALRVQFRNPDADYQEDEIIVLDDAHSYRGVDARGNPSSKPVASRFETLQLRFAQDAIHAWRVGRYHLAQAIYRPESYVWESDIAGLGVTRGDVVSLSSDVTEWGVGWGRVISSTYSGGRTYITLDNSIDFESGLSYSVQVRSDDGVTTVRAIQNPLGPTNVISYSGNSTASPGDVCTVGITGRVADKMLITGIRYSEGGFKTAFSAVKYSPQVAPYWSNPPASIISEITGQQYGIVPAPRLSGVVSEQESSASDDAGIMQPQITVAFVPNDEPIKRLQYRPETLVL